MEKLLQTLALMIASHTKLLDLAKEKRTILISESADGLQSVVIRENSCINEIQKLETERQRLVQEYMAQHGIVGHSFTLEELINSSDDELLKTRVSKTAEGLRSLIQEISQLNETNLQLIQTSLSYIQYSIGMHVRQEPAIGYGPNAGKRYSSLLDAKI